MSQSRPLWTGFLRSADQYPDNNALYVEGRFIAYKELRAKALQIATTIQKYTPDGEASLTGVFAYRSQTAFSGILGALLSGNGYVPINRTFPEKRSKIMFQRSGCNSVVVDTQSLRQLDAILEGCPRRILIILPELTDTEEIKKRWPQHIIIGKNELGTENDWRYPTTKDDDIAYLLFTSGSTGMPKGVMVSHENVIPFIDFAIDRYEITQKDRLSQMFDMTFDLSVFDMFVSWERGACVCCPSQKTLLNPAIFINKLQLTVWFSVPSTVIFMKRLNMLKPDAYPSLRWSLFCGEPLPVSSVEQWQRSANNSLVENLYGPTELTIACMYYRWSPNHSSSESHMGIVPIGYAFPHMDMMIVDENMHEVNYGEEGELIMTGPQMTPGYWKDPEKTESAFILPLGKNKKYYRTGDRVRKPEHGMPVPYLGRVDFQVKIHGHRVELGEIEAIVRKEVELDGVIALGWPLSDSGASGVEVFVEGKYDDVEGLRNRIKSKLPDYMIPNKFHFHEKLPLNSNGKYDRKTMLQILQENSK